MLGAEGLLALQQLGVDPAVALEAINGASASIASAPSAGSNPGGWVVGGQSVDPWIRSGHGFLKSGDQGKRSGRSVGAEVRSALKSNFW